MSFLFKALERAAQARNAVKTEDAAPIVGRPTLSSASRRPSRPWGVIAAVGLVIGAGLVVVVFDPFSLFDNNAPPPLLHRPPTPPAMKLPSPVATSTPVPMAPSAAPIPSSVSTASNTAAAPAPSPSPTAVVETAAPTALPPATSPAITPANPPATPPATRAAPVVAEPDFPPGPAPLRKPLPPQLHPVDADLPAILDQIRRDKAGSAIGEPVKVQRQATLPDLRDDDGQSAISVTVSKPTEQEDGKAAYAALMRGDYPGALQHYDRALRAAPYSVPLLLGKATAEQKLRNRVEARQLYRQVLAIDPQNREALTNMTALVAADAPEEALSELTALQTSYPEFSPIAAQIGAINAARGDLPQAIAALREAVRLSPGNGLYQLNLGVLDDRAGLADDAIQAYQTALQLLADSDVALPLPLDQIRQRLQYLQRR